MCHNNVSTVGHSIPTVMRTTHITAHERLLPRLVRQIDIISFASKRFTNAGAASKEVVAVAVAAEGVQMQVVSV